MIYDALAKEVFNWLENGEISVVDSRESARLITGNLDAVQTRKELVVFFDELTRKWPIYKQITDQLILLMPPDFYK